MEGVESVAFLCGSSTEPEAGCPARALAKLGGDSRTAPTALSPRRCDEGVGPLSVEQDVLVSGPISFQGASPFVSA